MGSIQDQLEDEWHGHGDEHIDDRVARSESAHDAHSGCLDIHSDAGYRDRGSTEVPLVVLSRHSCSDFESGRQGPLGQTHTHKPH